MAKNGQSIKAKRYIEIVSSFIDQNDGHRNPRLENAVLELAELYYDEHISEKLKLAAARRIEALPCRNKLI